MRHQTIITLHQMLYYYTHYNQLHWADIIYIYKIFLKITYIAQTHKCPSSLVVMTSALHAEGREFNPRLG